MAPGASLPCALCASTHPMGLGSLGSTRSHPRRRHLRHGPAGTCRQRQRLSRGRRGDRLLIGKGSPPLPGCPLAPRGRSGGGHRAAQHPATHLCPGGTRPPVGASGRCSGAGTRARWCLITGANEAAELHLHGSRGTPRRTATAAARGHRCYRAPGTRTGGMAGLAPAPLRWGPGVGQAPRPQRGDTPPEQPGPVPAAGGAGDPWRFWLR